MSLIVYLNGEYVPLKDARIPVMDRGFLFGDGVYELIPVYGDRIFRLDEHLARLQNSLDAIDIPNPHSDEEWETLIENVLSENPGSDHRSVYIEVTRGVGERDHLYEQQLKPTVFILCRPVIARDLSGGVSVITHPDIRWDYCHIKAISLLPGVLLKNHARNTGGAHEAILIRDGEVTEGAASNVFIVSNGIVATPPKDNRLLPGITRDLIVELLEGAGIKCEERVVTESDLNKAEEIWITSSVMEIAPVVRLDGRTLGNGAPGSMWQRVHELYEAFKQRMIAPLAEGN